MSYKMKRNLISFYKESYKNVIDFNMLNKEYTCCDIAAPYLQTVISYKL